jgi:hypothetical protein
MYISEHKAKNTDVFADEFFACIADIVHDVIKVSQGWEQVRFVRGR